MREIMFKTLSLFLLLISAWTVSAETIDDWLDKMSQASNQQNFQGTLIIRQKNQLQAIKVKQGVTGNGSWQTLESLTGENQTIFRQNNKVTTIFPNKKLVTIAGNSASSANSKGPLHPSLPENRQIIKQHYTLKLSGDERIANKMTQIIQMVPRDKHRYGYTFWLDKKSGMLLKCDLIDEQGFVLEQLMYSDVELLNKAPVNNVDTKKLALYRKVNLFDNVDVITKNWHAKQLPAGFALTRSVRIRAAKAQEKNQQGDKLPAPSYHIVYSDGMASVSVFIERRNKLDNPVIGKSSMGPVNAYSSFVNDTYVTAIGEVPASTVRMIAQSIQPVQ